MAFFVENDVPGGPVHNVHELLGDPQFQARAQVIDHVHPVAGPLRLLATPIRTGDPPVPIQPAPALGEPTDAVLAQLGYDNARIAALRRAHVLG